MYVHVTREWHSSKSYSRFVNELDPLAATQYPEPMPRDEFDPESQSGSPMSQAGGVTEAELLGGAGEIHLAENADVSMIDRSMDDAVA